ncbi:MAG: LacI family DNA-binding transcriptional regulator [Chitinophagaceae bacterium]
MEKVNIQRLADELKLSIATVSRALRDSYQIRPETRKRVWDLAKKLNYQPNPFASGLREQKSKNIAVIFPELANNFFSLAINGIEEIARQKGYQVLIYLTHESATNEIGFVNGLANGRVDGLLISLSSETGDYAHILDLNKKLPVILFDRVCESVDMLNVRTNDYESSYNGTLHLINKGCKKILYLLALKNLSAGKLRLKGYTDALAHAGIPLREKFVIDCDKDDKENYLLIKKAVVKQQPDGILSSIEKLGPACYHVANELKINIPGQLKIVSFSNLEIASLLNPSLTTITQPAFEIGKEAANILFQLLDKKKTVAESRVIESMLIERQSTATG